MIILSFTIVQAFVSKHSESAESLNRWYKITRKASWKEFSDIKRDFGSVDAVGNDRYVLIFEVTFLGWWHCYTLTKGPFI